jgi:hypothetical protein
MGTSGGGGPKSKFRPFKRINLQQRIRRAELEAADKEFSPRLAERLNGLVARVNDRDRVVATTCLDDIRKALPGQLKETFELWYGGALARHVGVSGLSDIDILLVLTTSQDGPAAALANVEQRMSETLPGDVQVAKGPMAVALTYPGGAEIQIMPAIRTTTGLRFPAGHDDEWSLVDAEAFCEALVERDESCSMRLVPTIKLAKTINAELASGQQLSGLHIEAMAVAAFTDYDGPKTVDKMLPYLFRSMSHLVLSPIRNSSGRKIQVDAHVGRSSSAPRRLRSQALDRIARRMDNATAARSLEQWNTIIEWTMQSQRDT